MGCPSDRRKAGQLCFQSSCSRNTYNVQPPSAEGLHGNDLKDDVGYNYVWYHLDFDVNEEHYKSAILKIRAKYNALVFLNGKEIGYDHHCTYSHAEFDISNAINYQGGSNELVVRVGSWNTASSHRRRIARNGGVIQELRVCGMMYLSNWEIQLGLSILRFYPKLITG